MPRSAAAVLARTRYEARVQRWLWVILLAAVDGDKIALTAGVSKDLTDQLKAGDLMREFATRLGGKGGGRSDMAQGGGTDVAALPAVLKDVPEWVQQRLQ